MKSIKLSIASLIIAISICGPVKANDENSDLMQEFKLLKLTIKEVQLALSLNCHKNYTPEYLIKHSPSLKKILAMKAMLLAKEDIDKALFSIDCPITML